MWFSKKIALFKSKSLLGILFLAILLFLIFIGFFLANPAEGFPRSLFYLYLILTSFVLFILAVSVVGIMDSIRIMNVIRELLKVTKKITEGNFDVKIGVKRGDEIGELARNLEEMRKALKRDFEYRRNLTDVLEIRLRARVAEIQRHKIILEETVRKRTRELQEKVDALERFRRVTVERELRMAQLLGEIKELQDELKKYEGRPKKLESKKSKI